MAREQPLSGKKVKNVQAFSTKNSLLVVVTLIAMGGCGPSGPLKYPVRGSVTFDGEPIPEGYITFVPENPSWAPEAGPITNGRFGFRARPGANKVEVEASKFIGPEIKTMGLRPKEAYIPRRYNFETTLTAEVTGDGNNDYEFDLESEPSKEGIAD